MTITSDDGALSLLRRLIERQSVTPNDEGCQSILSQRLIPLGFTCESMRFGEVDNLWARRGTADPLLCFAGHTDVVPAPRDDWISDPFTATVRDGKLYGRGAADMKGSISAFVIALETFVKRHPDHRGSIALLITSDEEGPATDGTRRVVEKLQSREEQIDWCLVGEPSSHRTVGDTIRIGRRGSLTGRLTINGTAGHVAYPHLAANPIMLFAPALADLCDRRWDDGNEHFPPTSFQVVKIKCNGEAVNVIPSSLFVRFNFRYSTEWDEAALKSAVEQILERHSLRYDISWHTSGRPFLTNGGPLVEATQRAVHAETGHQPELSTGGGTSDGRFIAPSGADVVELGPVNASIHKPNEHVAVEDLHKLTAIYQRLLEDLLVNR